MTIGRSWPGNQVLDLLLLDSAVVAMLSPEDLPEAGGQLVTERLIRPLLKLDAAGQVQAAAKILA